MTFHYQSALRNDDEGEITGLRTEPRYLSPTPFLCHLYLLLMSLHTHENLFLKPLKVFAFTLYQLYNNRHESLDKQISHLLQQEVENFKKLNVISQDEFDTLTPKVPVDSTQEVPRPPMPGWILTV